MARKGHYKYECADCGNTQMEHAQVMSRRCRPRCQKCGSTFLNPSSDNAIEDQYKAGAARTIKEEINPNVTTGRENVSMRDRL